MIRRWVKRRGTSATYALVSERGGVLGVTLWRRGALSLLTPAGMVQVVVGDWWEAHP